jgi:hypothetical protein
MWLIFLPLLLDNNVADAPTPTLLHMLLARACIAQQQVLHQVQAMAARAAHALTRRVIQLARSFYLAGSSYCSPAAAGKVRGGGGSAHHPVQQPVICTPVEGALTLLPLPGDTAVRTTAGSTAAVPGGVLRDAALHATLMTTRLAASALCQRIKLRVWTSRQHLVKALKDVFITLQGQHSFCRINTQRAGGREGLCR